MMQSTAISSNDIFFPQIKKQSSMVCVLDTVVALYQTPGLKKNKDGVHHRTYQEFGDALLGLWGGVYALRRQFQSWRGVDSKKLNSDAKPKNEKRTSKKSEAF
jgi:hypothetical protein